MHGCSSGMAFVEWCNHANEKTPSPLPGRITLIDETGKVKSIWKFKSAVILKYTGPGLNGKGTGDVAIEELEIVGEGIEPTDSDGNKPPKP